MAALLVAGAGCHQPVTEGSLVVTQVPTGAVTSAVRAETDRSGVASAGPSERGQGTTVLDARYPRGTRVVLAGGRSASESVRVLSQGLVAAGGPVVAPDGRRVLFVGLPAPGAAWQVYEADLAGGSPRMLTSVPGGAMDPAWLKDGNFVFASPVPAAAAPWAPPQRPQLFTKSPATGTIQRLTFAEGGAADPTVLRDGRILFVSARLGTKPGESPGSALLTINNDGTEVAGFAGQHDAPGWVRRPRLLAPGRIGFLAGAAGAQAKAEAVSMARPMASRVPFGAPFTAGVTSLESDGQGGILFCQPRASENRSSWAVHRCAAVGAHQGEASGGPAEEPPCEIVFDDPGFEDIEAVVLASRPAPMGRVSTMVPGRRTGQILCLNVNHSTEKAGSGTVAPAARLRVFAVKAEGGTEVLGEAAVQADGSLLAEVPADRPLGFEALDEQGRVLRRQEPVLWVRPGENRSCVGCHEPHHRAPRNGRPLAVNQPPVRLLGQTGERLLTGAPDEAHGLAQRSARSRGTQP